MPNCDDVEPEESVPLDVRRFAADAAQSLIHQHHERLRRVREETATVREISRRVAQNSLRARQENIRRAMEQPTVGEITRQVALDAVRERKEQIRRVQDELRQNMNRQRRETVEILRLRLSRPQEKSCRLNRPRSTIVVRSSRRRVARRLTPSRDGPHRRSSDDDHPRLARRSRRRSDVLGGRR